MKKSKLAGVIFSVVLLAGCGAAKEPEQAESLTQEQQDSIAAELESQMDAMLESTVGDLDVELPEIEISDSEVTDPMESIPGQLGEIHDEILGEFTGDMDLVGSWQDVMSERAALSITENEDGSYLFTITWSSSADETSVWEISGNWDSEMGGLIYEDGTYYVLKNGTEKFDETTTDGAFMKEGDYLRWADSKIEKDAVFEKE